MINKKYPTNTSEIKNLSKQAKSLIFTEKNHYTSSSIKLVEFFHILDKLTFYQRE